MQPLIYRSEGDQGVRPGVSQMQRDRMGRVLPMVDEHGRPWTFIRLVCEVILCACALFLPFAVWAVLS